MSGTPIPAFPQMQSAHLGEGAKLLVVCGQTYRGAVIVRTAAGAALLGEPFHFRDADEARAFVDARRLLDELTADGFELVSYAECTPVEA